MNNENDGIDYLNKIGLKILPKWINEKPFIEIEYKGNKEFIECVHTVVFHDVAEKLLETLDAKKLKDDIDIENVVPEETRKFAFYSFCQSVCENFPNSISEDMIGFTLNIRFRGSLKRLKVNGYENEFNDKNIVNTRIIDIVDRLSAMVVFSILLIFCVFNIINNGKIVDMICFLFLSLSSYLIFVYFFRLHIMLVLKKKAIEMFRFGYNKVQIYMVLPIKSYRLDKILKGIKINNIN